MHLRIALRSLRGTPWYSSTVIGVVALTIALAATVFAVIDGVLFRPLPYPNADQLFVVGGSSRAKSLRDVREWAEAVPDAQVAAYQAPFDIGFVGNGQTTILYGAAVGETFFDVLGVRPALGGLRPEHFEPTAGPVPVLISHRLWRQQFGGAGDAVGRRVPIAGTMNHMATPLPGLEVVGVLPADFVYPSNSESPDLILPIALGPEDASDRNASAAGVIVRLPAGTSPAVIESRLTAVAAAQGLLNMRPSGPPATITLRPIGEILTLFTWRDFRTVFLIAAALVILACVNLAGLTMARGEDRMRQFALQQALGASGWHLTRQAMLELAPLAGVGTVLGLLAAPVCIRVVTRLIPDSVALLGVPAVDVRVVAFGALAALLTMGLVVFGQRRAAAATDMSQTMGRGQTVTGRHGRFAAVVVALQVGLGLVLTVGGALLVSSLFRAWGEDPGFDAEHGALVELDLTRLSTADRAAALSRARAVVDSVPDVRASGAVHFWFLRDSGAMPATRLRVPGASEPRDTGQVGYSGDFFDAMGMRPVLGRLPTRDEVAALEPVLVVSERLARELWPGTSPLGQTVTHTSGRSLGTVVGVVPDARYDRLDRESRGHLYGPANNAWPQPTILIGAEASSADVLRRVTSALGTADPPIAVVRALTLGEALGNSIRARTFRAWLFGSFAAASLVIAGVGILGLTAMSTARRTREMGVRRALGASRRTLVLMLLREQAVALGAGLAFGGLAGAWAVGYLASLAYRFSVYDARIWLAAIAMVLATAVLGTLLPAVRASHADPADALRQE